jgi:hypothetical protein
MHFDSGTTSATGQVSNVVDRVYAIEFHARSDNPGSVTVGVSDVTADNGRELAPGEPVTFNFGLVEKEGSVPFNLFYVDLGIGGNQIDWSVIKE